MNIMGAVQQEPVNTVTATAYGFKEGQICVSLSTLKECSPESSSIYPSAKILALSLFPFPLQTRGKHRLLQVRDNQTEIKQPFNSASIPELSYDEYF